MEYPADLRYSTDHEWVRVEGSRARIGITEYAQDALGDVVYVDLPEVGREVTAGGSLGEVESTKSVSDIYSPVSGTVVEVNADLADAPDRINDDPYGDGWMCIVEASDAGVLGEELAGLMDSDAYGELVES